MRILILEHEPDTPAALLGEWAQERGHDQVVASVAELARWPDASDYDAIVSLGSDRSVHADPPQWVAPELELLRSAYAQDIPVLGICFGGQALAMALRAPVALAAQAEARWGTIDTDAPELITPGPWFCWHVDEFATPADARLLSGSRRKTMAFAAGRSIALQYHPEVDAELARAWIDGGRAKLKRQGVRTDDLYRQVEKHGPGARTRAFDQFDRIAAWWKRSSRLAAR
jgi:GMP synthase-like glutamine amidotransferase